MKSDNSISPAALADHVQTALDDGKAVDIRVLNVTGLTSITDYMIVASGPTSRQVKALTERVRAAVVALGLRPLGVEGEASAEWVLVDFGDVLVHIMQAETRDFYQLEKLWDTAPSVQVDAG